MRKSFWCYSSRKIMIRKIRKKSGGNYQWSFLPEYKAGMISVIRSSIKEKENRSQDFGISGMKRKGKE